MTVYYVDSAAGSNTSPYDTWAKAATSLATIAAIDAAGDTIYVASTHNETGVTPNPAYNWAGTIASPTKIICADKTSGAPPTTAATGGTIATASGIALTFASAGYVYIYGLTLQAGAGTSSSANVNLHTAANAGIVYEKCTFYLNNTASSTVGTTGNGANANLVNCTFKFGAVGQSINSPGAGAETNIVGGSIDGTGSAITKLLGIGAGSLTSFTGFDCSSCAASLNVVSSTVNAAIVTMAMCKLPGGWTGSPNGSTGGLGTSIEMYQCDSSGITYTLNIERGPGQITDSTTVVLSGGATDGTTPISWTVATDSQSGFPFMPLHSEWRAIWIDTTTSKTLTWQYVADTNVAAGQGAGTAFAFQNNQVWIEAVYFGSSTSPLGTIASSAPSTPLAAATDNAAGTGTWTTTGLTTPKKGQCTLTFTTSLKGPMLSRIVVGTASKTIYADPAPTFA